MAKRKWSLQNNNKYLVGLVGSEGFSGVMTGIELDTDEDDDDDP